MFINFQECFNVIPIIIIAAGIVFSLLIEMYSKKSEVFLPWFSVLMFLAAGLHSLFYTCLLYTSDAADDLLCVDLGGRRNIKKKNN